MLTFYYGAGSPYAWRVWLALEHKRAPYELKTMSFSAGDLRNPEYLAVNPRRKVPAIVDDGFALYESVAVVEYLDEKYAGPKVFPGDTRQRALIRRMVQEADQYYALAMEKLAAQVLFTAPDKWDAGEISEGREGVTRELALWESLIRGDYPCGRAVGGGLHALSADRSEPQTGKEKAGPQPAREHWAQDRRLDEAHRGAALLSENLAAALEVMSL
jgi:glutathione S-transferase